MTYPQGRKTTAFKIPNQLRPLEKRYLAYFRINTGNKNMTDFSKMTKEERIAYLKNMSDSEIDYSDIPPITDFTGFQAVKREVIDGKLRIINRTPLYNHLTVAKKKSVSIRLDEDIIEWLKTQSNQYQTHINAVLRAYYEANKSNK